MKRIKSLPLVISIVLIGIAGFGFFSIIQGLRNDVTILVAKDNLSANTYVNSQDFDTLDIPEVVLTPDMLTEKEYNEKYLDSDTGEDKGAVLTYPFLKNQWIIQEGISDDSRSTFAVLLPDERAVSVTASSAGAMNGAIRSGDVVQVSPTDSGYGESFQSVDYAKVLCITTESNGCSSLVSTEAPDSSPVDAGQDGGPFSIILAVPRSVSAEVSGKEVALSLDTFCFVGPRGMFTGAECSAKNSNLMAARDLRQAAQAELGTTGATGATGTDGES